MKVYAVYSRYGNVDYCECIHKTVEGAEHKKTILETEEGLRQMKESSKPSEIYWIATYDLEE